MTSSRSKNGRPMVDETTALLRRVDHERRAYRGDGHDPVLAAIADAHHRHQLARQHLRLLLAYGRTVVHPRPYTLAELATAADMSISGVRTAYNDGDIEAVTACIH